MKALFEGERALFTGLAAETRWDWSRRHPVIRISFGGGVVSSEAGLVQRIQHGLRGNFRALGLARADDIPFDDVAGHLADLIERDAQGRAVRAAGSMLTSAASSRPRASCAAPAWRRSPQARPRVASCPA